MKDLTSIIKHFKALLPCEQFYVAGSYALKIVGLTDNEPKDLDIVLVNPKDESVEILKRLQSENPAKTKPKEGSELLAILIHDGIKVDFFNSKKKIDTIKCVDFELSPVNFIVAAKRQHDRVKDWIQLYKIADNICNRYEFDEKLLNISLSENEEY